MEKNHLVQICSSVMNSSFFEVKVRYFDNEAYCVQKKVLFKNADKYSSDIEKEWMIRCPVEALTKNMETSHYVSQGNAPENFFVCYGNSENELCYLENLSTNIVTSILKFNIQE